MQKIQQGGTLTDVPTVRHLLKIKVTNLCSRLGREGRLNLKASKHKALIDFVACQPHYTTKVVTHENSTHGFLEAGYIDKKSLHYPDFDKILRTCRRDPTIQEHNLCKHFFVNLIKIYSEKGHVTDDIFEKLGFPMDNDPLS